MYCKQCGQQMPDQSLFCPNCGAPAGQGGAQQYNRYDPRGVQNGPYGAGTWEGPENTNMPMTYYRVLKVLMILELIFQAFSIVATLWRVIFSLIIFAPFQVISLVLLAAEFVCLLYARIKMPKGEKAGLGALYIYLGITVVYSVINLLFFFSAESFGGIIGSLIVAIPTVLYFEKRKHLFTR